MNEKSFATSLSCIDGRVQLHMITWIIISISHHKSSHIVISGHFGCAGNPVSEEEHFIHIKKSVDIVNSWNLDADVIGVWIDENFVPHLL